jgi:hypothetical protein
MFGLGVQRRSGLIEKQNLRTHRTREREREKRERDRDRVSE